MSTVRISFDRVSGYAPRNSCPASGKAIFFVLADLCINLSIDPDDIPPPWSFPGKTPEIIPFRTVFKSIMVVCNSRKSEFTKPRLFAFDLASSSLRSYARRIRKPILPTTVRQYLSFLCVGKRNWWDTRLKLPAVNPGWHHAMQNQFPPVHTDLPAGQRWVSERLSRTVIAAKGSCTSSGSLAISSAVRAQIKPPLTISLTSFVSFNANDCRLDIQDFDFFKRPISSRRVTPWCMTRASMNSPSLNGLPSSRTVDNKRANFICSPSSLSSVTVTGISCIPL